MDERRLSRAWDAIQQVPTTEWDAAVRVPLCVRNMLAAGETLKQRIGGDADLLGLEEILCVSDEHLLHADI